MKRLTALLAPFLMLNWFQKNDFLRRYQGASWMEFPMTKENYRTTFKVLLQNQKPGDMVLTTGQTSFYLMYESGREAEALGRKLMRVQCRGRDFYFDSTRWAYESTEQFTTAFRKLRTQVDLTQAHRLWLFNLGWGRGFPEKLEKTTVVEVEGGSLYALDQSRFEAMMRQGNNFRERRVPARQSGPPIPGWGQRQ